MEERINANCVDVLTDCCYTATIYLLAMKILALCTSCFLKRNFVHFAHVKGMEEEIYSSFVENTGTKSENNIVDATDVVENNDMYNDSLTTVNSNNDNGDITRNDEDSIILDDGYND
eukprot:Awhi_evm1s14192